MCQSLLGVVVVDHTELPGLHLQNQTVVQQPSLNHLNPVEVFSVCDSSTFLNLNTDVLSQCLWMKMHFVVVYQKLALLRT